MTDLTSYVSLAAAAELLDCSTGHVLELCDAGEITAIDISARRGTGGVTIGVDGKRYPARKRRLRVSVESIRTFTETRVSQQQPQPPKRARMKPRKAWY